MPVAFQITIQGTERIEKNWGRMKTRALNMRPVFLGITYDFRRMMVRQFDSEGSYLLGRRWQSLAQATIETKRARGGDSRILHDSRKMRQSFTQGRGALRVINNHEMTIESGLDYANVHQLGSDKIPRRQIVKIRPSDSRRWARAVRIFVVHGRVEIARPY